MEWLFKNCSTTAQRGALDWSTKFEKVLLPVIPVMEQCYNNVIKNNDSDYKNKLNDEFELWKVANECCDLNINDDNLPLFTL